MASMVISNVTDPARVPMSGLAKWGDTIRVTPSGVGNGKNYYSIKAFDQNQNDPTLSYIQRKVANGDTPVEFTLGQDDNGISPWNPITPPGYPQETQVSIYIWADDDDILGGGKPNIQAAFYVQAP